MPSLAQVRAAQLRARVSRGAIIKVALGTVFLVGAISYARAPDRALRSSVAWMTALLLFSTINVGTGLRALARVRRWAASLWVAATAAWFVLSTLTVGFLLRG